MKHRLKALSYKNRSTDQSSQLVETHEKIGSVWLVYIISPLLMTLHAYRMFPFVSWLYGMNLSSICCDLIPSSWSSSLANREIGLPYKTESCIKCKTWYIIIRPYHHILLRVHGYKGIIYHIYNTCSQKFRRTKLSSNLYT